jgi:hypothetical protein
MRYILGLFAAAAGAAFALATPAAAGGFDSVDLSGQKKLSDFKAVYVAPVELALDRRGGYRRGGGSARTVDENTAAHKAVDLQRALLEQFVAAKFDLSRGPGPGILTVSATLTKLEPNGRTVDDYKSSPSLSPMSSSRVEGEGAAVRIALSENGASLGTVADDYDDTRLAASESVWAEVDEAFALWASGLVEVVKSN